MPAKQLQAEPRQQQLSRRPPTTDLHRDVCHQVGAKQSRLNHTTTNRHACCLPSSSAVNASTHPLPPSSPPSAPPLHPKTNIPTPPAALPKPQPLGVRIPPLPSGQRPNFIVVLTDDQGFDDLGAHQPQQPGGRPQWVSTPNLDKFLSQSMEFRNFYVSPMCSQSRAELLTGRSYQRTGTMLINGGGLGRCLGGGQKGAGRGFGARSSVRLAAPLSSMQKAQQKGVDRRSSCRGSVGSSSSRARPGSAPTHYNMLCPTLCCCQVTIT
jgi:hypothetical protein